MVKKVNGQLQKILRIAGEVLSQMLNVPILSGAMIIFLFLRLPIEIPNRVSGFSLTLVFLCLIPLASLFFYIPGKLRDWPKIIKRQRIASFVIMIVSYPIGYVILRLTQAPRIYEAIAATYTLVTLGLIFFNLILRYKASGHAAGVAGPVGALVYFYGFIATPLLALLPLVTLARLFAKGHDVWQTVVGSAMSLSITILVLRLYGFLPLSGLLY
jgi:hypothetical protein